MSIDKAHIATILELSTPKEMFNALDHNYSARIAACLRQLLHDCQATSKQKNVSVMKKYESMLNLNAEIHLQKLELTFSDEYLINFPLASIPSTYEEIIDNLNMGDTLMLDGAVCALCTKETELTNLGAIKENNAHFATRRGFCGGRGGRGGAGVHTISRNPDGGYAIQGHSSRNAINCFYYKNNGHAWRDCTLQLATETRKKWKASDKSELYAANGTLFNTIQELLSFAVTVDEDESEQVNICQSYIENNTVEVSQLASDEALLYFSYSQVVFASVALFPTATLPSNVSMIVGSDLQKTGSQSWHLDKACSRHLPSEKDLFVGRLT